MRTSRGVTLVELVIAMVVTAFAISGALLMSQAQQRLFSTGNKQRQAQQNARAAILFLEDKIRLAGFGMDPANAFDFAWYGCAAGPASCPRDSVAGPDELVFYARDPNYRLVTDPATEVTTFHGRAWQATQVTPASIQILARKTETFLKGQILQLACGKELRFTHVTVQAKTTALGPGPLDIPLEPVFPGVLARDVPADPFRRQDAADRANADFTKWNACFTVQPRVFLIDRYRFYVRPVDMGGGRFDPYLVLDQGLDTNDDTQIDADDEIMVAEGIENFQVAYQFIDPNLPLAGDLPGTPISVPAVGSTPGSAFQTITPTNFPGPYDASVAYPILNSSQFFASSMPPLPKPRQTNDQGNLRAVHVAVVARSPEPDPTTPSNLSYTPGSPLWIYNFNALPPFIADYLAAHSNEDHYLRAVMDTAVPVPNMAARGLLPN
jgi:type IV pilus assembly protein PilW